MDQERLLAKCNLIARRTHFALRAEKNLLIRSIDGYKITQPRTNEKIKEVKNKAMHESQADFNSFSGCANCPVYRKCLPTPTTLGDTANEPKVVYAAMISNLEVGIV